MLPTRNLAAPMATASALPRRLAALVVDAIVVSALDALFGGVFGVERVASGSPLPAGAGGFAWFTTTTSLEWPWLLVVWLGYYAVSEVMFAASPGKLTVGLRVVALDGRASIPKVLLRNVLRPLDVLPAAYVLGGLAVLASTHHQRLGDLAAGTIVVRSEAAVDVRPTHLRLKLAALSVAAVCALGGLLAFDYFGRPPLVIAGMWNTGRLSLGPSYPISGYSLGQSTWAGDDVSYFITYRGQSGRDCVGQISLRWHGYLTGWVASGRVARC